MFGIAAWSVVNGTVGQSSGSERSGMAVFHSEHFFVEPTWAANLVKATDRKYNGDVWYRGVVRGQRHSGAVERF